ncbi:MAG: hypothetical protein O2909_08900 [Chloroflexi bacterium]|nr:hypothetical protein [Chloroflexota bacterium]MDA1219545.1 hypothetical protein [Chloroflexota bacterium]
MQNTISGITEKTSISIGSDPIDKALLGGLPLGSLSLIEGPSGVGKSVVIQHYAFGALMAELGVGYYVSGTDQEGLIKKMNSLYLEVNAFLGEGQLLIYPISDFYDGREDASASLRKLRKHMEQLPWDVSVIVVDTLTNLVNQAGTDESFNFFLSCKEICSWDKTLLFAMHTASMDPDLLTRLDKLFDTHLTLRIEALSQGVQLKTMNVIDIAKVKNAKLQKKTSIYFEIDPELGRSMNMSLKVLPFFKLRT